MEETNSTEKAFIVRFNQSKGFNVESLGGDIPINEIIAMMDACQRQFIHGRLSAIEDAVRAQSAYMKQMMMLIKPPADSESEPESSKE